MFSIRKRIYSLNLFTSIPNDSTSRTNPVEYIVQMFSRRMWGGRLTIGAEICLLSSCLIFSSQRFMRNRTRKPTQQLYFTDSYIEWTGDIQHIQYIGLRWNYISEVCCYNSVSLVTDELITTSIQYIYRTRHGRTIWTRVVWGEGDWWWTMGNTSGEYKEGGMMLSSMMARLDVVLRYCIH